MYFLEAEITAYNMLSVEYHKEIFKPNSYQGQVQSYMLSCYRMPLFDTLPYKCVSTILSLPGIKMQGVDHRW